MLPKNNYFKELMIDFVSLLAFFILSFTTLFSVVNPFGAMPVFLALTANDSKEYRISQARKAAINMTWILGFFLLAGVFILHFFGISLEAIRIAGGLIILRSGYRLLNTVEKQSLTKESKLEGMRKKDISFTPLALPLLSGPGSIAAVITLASQTDNLFEYGAAFLAILVVSIITFLVLRISMKLMPLLGSGGMDALSKIMGFIIMCLGIQFIINGLYPVLESVFV